LEIFIDKNKFQTEIAGVMGVIEKKSPIPILESLHISNDGGLRIKLIATNLELGISSSCPVEKIDGTDSLCVSCRRLYYQNF
jgi:DNA polymerase III sliding clamp (beta) subunit (PCNA family)